MYVCRACTVHTHTVALQVSAADWATLKREHPVAKVDLLRLIVMYEQGGLYSDVDRLFNKDLDQLIGSRARLLLPTHFDTDFSQDLMASSPGNRLFKEAIELNLVRRRTMRHNARGAISSGDLLHLGPISYSHAVLTAIFGVRVDRPAMGHAMQRIRAALADTNGLIVAPRETKCHTAVYAGPDTTGSCAKWLDKSALQAEFRRKAWTDEINSAWSSRDPTGTGRDHNELVRRGVRAAIVTSPGKLARSRGRARGRGTAAWSTSQKRARRSNAHRPAAAKAWRRTSGARARDLGVAEVAAGVVAEAAVLTMELPLLYAVDSIQLGRDTHERQKPWYRVRLAGPALVVAPVRRLQAAVCRDDASPAEVYPILRNSSMAGMRAGLPWCVGHVAELMVPVAERYFVEAITLFDDFAIERYEEHCSALRPGAPPLLTATVELGRSYRAAAQLGGGASLLDPVAAAAALQPRAVRTRVQEAARCSASKATLALDVRGAAQHAPGYRWVAVDTAGTWEARAAPLPPGTCVVGDSQGRNLCLPDCTSHSAECEAVVRAPRDSCRFFRANYPQEAECSAWNGAWSDRLGVPLQGCRHVLLSFGQWSMRFRRRNGRPVLQQLGNFSKALAHLASSLHAGGAATVWLLSTLEVPPGCLVTSCPAATFQTPPLTHAYNDAIERASRQEGVGYMSLDMAILPLWDAAPDWSHADSRAVTAMRTIVTARIEAATTAAGLTAEKASPAVEAWEPPTASSRTLWVTQRRGGFAWRRGGAKGRGPKPNAFC